MKKNPHMEGWMIAENHLPDQPNFQYSILSYGTRSIAEVWRTNFRKVGKDKFKVNGKKSVLHKDIDARKVAILIAAAPELLRALQDLCTNVAPHIHKLNVRKGYSEKVALAQALKTIQKATKGN